MIIFLSGSINSGKTTIARILVQKIPDCVNLEVDNICELVNHIDRKDIEVLILENIVSLIFDYIKHDLNVVVNYTFGDTTFEFVKKQLAALHQDIYLFTLNPTLEVALSKRGEEKKETFDKERIKYHYKLGINNLKSSISIDNSHQIPEETAKEVLSKIR